MATEDDAAPPFDVFALSEDVRNRFGWSNDDLNRVMVQLLPAALSGFQVFGMPSLGSAGQQVNPFASAAALFQSPSAQPLSAFFGPEAVQRALAAQVSSLTGTSSDAVQELMPVAATLAFGQVARPFFHGEARNLLDAYLRGFARGRPKPQPTPVDYLQGYTQAMKAFWGAFLTVPEPEDESADDHETGDVERQDGQPEQDAEAEHGAGQEQDTEPSEFEAMVAGWMAAGRDFQSSQFRAFDSFFARASKDLGA